MHSKRIRTLCLASLLIAHAAGCSGLHTRLSDRLRRADSGTDGRDTPGVARLDSPDAPERAQLGADESPAPSIRPAPQSVARPGGVKSANPADGDRPSTEPVVDPRIAARALLEDLGARITEDEAGEIVAIDLAETGVTDDDLRQIAVFKSVRELNLRGTIVTDAGLAALSELTDVEFLGLTGTQVSDAGLARLGRLPRLRFLTLGRTSVSDSGLSTIVKWSQLEGLNVKATHVTDRGAARLKRQLPKCRVIVDGPRPGADRHDSGNANSRSVRDRAANATESRPLDEPVRAPVLPQPLPGRETETESGDPDSLQPARDSGGTNGGTRGRRPFNVEEDWESAVASPANSAVALDPQQRLMFILRQKLEDPDVLKAIAEVQLSQQQPNEALRLLEAAADRAPEDRELRYVLGVTRARCGDYDGAYDEFVTAVGEAAAHYNLGVLLHEAGDDTHGIREFQRALRCDPSFRAAREWLTALTLPEGGASSVADSQLLSDEEIRSLILRWSDRKSPQVQTTPRRLEGAPPRLETVSPIVEPASPPVEAAASHVENATRVEPELYPRFGTQAGAEVQPH